MGHLSSAKTQRSATFFILLLAMLLLLNSKASHVASQSTNDPVTLSYQAFSQLERVYRTGGQAPDLVAKLNLAVSMIQEARIKRAQGDANEADRLEAEARSTIGSVLDAIPAAQEQANSASNTKTLTVLASIPVVVILSTFAFYSALRAWRYYEKMKLFEMRIVEKKTEA